MTELDSDTEVAEKEAAVSESALPKKVTFGLLWKLLSSAFVLWVIYWCATVFFTKDWTDRSGFGEMFGGINALFSAFAFAGLIFTILLQREELELQREELRQTRKEIKGQKEQLAAQNATFQRQTHDAIFFQLLTLHGELTGAVTFGKDTGRRCFGEMYGVLRNNYHDARGRDRISDEMKAGVVAYEKFYRENQDRCGHYFRTLYNIFKFIKNSKVVDKKFYSNLVRAQLSSSELCLLFYNCASPLGAEKFRPLIEEFGVLKQLDKRLLLDPKHEGFYQASAFS